MVGGKLLAGDSTKFRAQNSNYNLKKVRRHRVYIEEKLSLYHELLEKEENEEEGNMLNNEIDKQEERQIKYVQLSDQLGKVMGDIVHDKYSKLGIMESLGLSYKLDGSFRQTAVSQY